MLEPKEEIRAKIDIVELIQEYLPLKQAGSVSWKGLCPFHGEKTPSFHVSRDKQIWHCFGCGEGGDCFAFVMRMEGMEFPEALRHLGEKAGVEVAQYSSVQSNEKQRLLAANAFAAQYYRAVLAAPTGGAVARAYLAQRGIPDSLAAAFGLGYAPDGWDALALAFAKKGLTEADGERAGLLMRRKQGGGCIDRFRNRLMIPLRDAQGNVVGFTGRAFGPNADAQGPKYMNSPETAVYRKGAILFGLDLAKRHIREAGRVIVVEGNLDVLASHKAGVGNIVASSGTALTDMQLTLLKRYTNTVVFSFDADAAGFKAAQRGIALARGLGLDVRAAVLPAEAGKDPDEAVQKDPALWRAAVERTVPIMQYYVDRAIAGRDLNDVGDKRAVWAFLKPEFAHITDVVEREHWLQTVADVLRMDVAHLRQDVVGLAKAGVPQKPPPAVPAPSPGPIAPHVKPARDEQAMRLLAGLFVNLPACRPLLLETLPPDWPAEYPPPFTLYTHAVFAYNQQRSSPSAQEAPLYALLQERLRTLSAPERDLLLPLLDVAVLEAERLTADLPPKDAVGHARQLIEAVTASEARRRRKAFEADLRRAEQAGNQEEVQRLLARLTDM